MGEISPHGDMNVKKYLESQAFFFFYILMQQTPPIRSNNQIKKQTLKSILQLQSEAGLVFGKKKKKKDDSWGQLEDTAPSLTSLVLSLSFLLKTSD